MMPVLRQVEYAKFVKTWRRCYRWKIVIAPIADVEVHVDW